MINEAENSPPSEVKKHLRVTKPGWASKIALLAVIERKRVSRAVDYKSIALQHGVTEGSLRQLYYRWKKGLVDLGEPQTEQERQIDSRVHMEKKLLLLRRYSALLLKAFEGALFEAEDEMGKGNREAWRQSGLTAIRNELKSVHELIMKTETGFVAIVDEYRAQEKAIEQRALTSSKPIDVVVQVVNANEEAAALAALDS